MTNHAEIIRQGLAHANRDHVMKRRILGDIEPDFPFERPSLVTFCNSVLAHEYLPAIREALNKPGPLSHLLED